MFSNRISAHAVAGLDLSLKSSGVCVIDSDGTFRTMAYGYELRGANERQRIDRLVSIAESIVAFIKPFAPKWIGIEGFSFGKTFRAHQLGELAGVVKVKCLEHLGLYVNPIPPKSARKYLLETCPAKSAKAKKAVRDHFVAFGHRFETDDESDAAAIAVVMHDLANVERATLPLHKLELVHRLDSQGVQCGGSE